MRIAPRGDDHTRDREHDDARRYAEDGDVVVFNPEPVIAARGFPDDLVEGLALRAVGPEPKAKPEAERAGDGRGDQGDGAIDLVGRERRCEAEGQPEVADSPARQEA